MMNSGTQKLDHILSLSKSSSNHHGLRYQHDKDSNSQGVFVKASSQIASPSRVKLPYLQKGKVVAHSSPVHQGKNNKFIPNCHFCHVKGHIRPNCFKLIKYMKNVVFFNYTHGKPRMTPRPKVETSENKPITTSIRKTNYKTYVSFISLRTCTTDFRYFDSGCSRHITSDRSALTNYQKLDRENLTFVDGVKSRVLGKGTLNVEGFPKLDNVLHVEDLKANLLSISQICYQNLFVNFDRNKCCVLDVDGNCILEGHRSSDHCYKLASSIVCHKTTLDDTEL